MSFDYKLRCNKWRKLLMKISLILLIVLIIASFSLGVYYKANQSTQTDNSYQGPVRPTDDEDHFRKTGITMDKEGENN